MAAVRLTKQAPVGSVQWILDEEDFANQFVRQEVDDFAFSAYNELEWLNEHMAEVFNRTELYERAQCRVWASELIKNQAMLLKFSKRLENYGARPQRLYGSAILWKLEL